MLHENINATRTSEIEDRDAEKIGVETAELVLSAPRHIGEVALKGLAGSNPNYISHAKEGEQTLGGALREAGGVVLGILAVSNPAEAAVREYVDRELSDEERAARKRNDYELAA